MLRSAHIIAPITGMMLISACSPPPIDVAIQRVGADIKIMLSQKWGLFSDKKAPCVKTIELYRGNDGVGKPVWKVDADGGGQCIDNVSSVVLGQAPKRFSTVKALPSSSAGSHTLVISGIGYGKASLILP